MWKRGKLKYSLNNILGQGSYGEVYKGTFSYNDVIKNCAVKVINDDSSVWGFSNFNEIEILYKLGKKSQFIVELYTIDIENYDSNFIAISNDKKAYIRPVLELANMDGMKFFETGNYNFRDVKLMCSQILLGVDHLHRHGICHRDLKSSNLLVFFKNGSPHIKITDFGFSTFLPFKGERESHIHTIWYRAPEIAFEVNNYKVTSDNWCIGIIFIEMVIKDHFFRPVGRNPTLSQYMDYCIENIASEWTEALQDLYRHFTLCRQEIKVKGKSSVRRIKQVRKNYVGYLTNNKKMPISESDLRLFSNMVSEFLTFDYPNRAGCYHIVTEHPFFADIQSYVTEKHNLQYSKRNYDKIFFDVPESINDLKVQYFSNAVMKLHYIPIRHFFYAVDLVNRFFTEMKDYDYDCNDAFAACTYFTHKMLSFVSDYVNPEKFFFHRYPSGRLNSKDKNFLYEFIYCFERNLVENYDKFGYFLRASIYDMQNCYKDHLHCYEEHNLRRETLVIFLTEYCKISTWESGRSYRYMYRMLYKKIVDENFEED